MMFCSLSVLPPSTPSSSPPSSAVTVLPEVEVVVVCVLVLLPSAPCSRLEPRLCTVLLQPLRMPVVRRMAARIVFFIGGLCKKI